MPHYVLLFHCIDEAASTRSTLNSHPSKYNQLKQHPSISGAGAEELGDEGGNIGGGEARVRLQVRTR